MSLGQVMEKTAVSLYRTRRMSVHSGPLAALLLDHRNCGALEGFPLAALT